MCHEVAISFACLLTCTFGCHDHLLVCGFLGPAGPQLPSDWDLCTCDAPENRCRLSVSAVCTRAHRPEEAAVHQCANMAVLLLNLSWRASLLICSTIVQIKLHDFDEGALNGLEERSPADAMRILEVFRTSNPQEKDNKCEALHSIPTVSRLLRVFGVDAPELTASGPSHCSPTSHTRSEAHFTRCRSLLAM